MKIKCVKFIESKDWDKLVEDTYKRPYRLQQQQGCMDRGTIQLIVPDDTEDIPDTIVPEIVNSDVHGVCFASWLERDPKLRLEQQIGEWECVLWWHRHFYPDLQMVANDLHAKGLLPAGEYVLNIDW